MTASRASTRLAQQKLRMLRQLIQKRPIASSALLSTSAAMGYGAWLEYRANREWQALPREYDFEAIHSYWANRPLSTATRFAQVFSQLAPVAGGYVWDFYVAPSSSEQQQLERHHAAQLREALTNLGPAFVKLGQNLSIRPDFCSPTVLAELQKLCDSVRPIPDEIALQLIREQLDVEDLSKIFQDGNLELVASASLGQVYKATLLDDDGAKDGAIKPEQQVAVKVQRPHMRQSFSLDLFLLQRFGLLVDWFTSRFTNQPPFHEALYNSYARGSYLELDYLHEAQNQMEFRREFAARKVAVVVPKVFEKYSTEQVLTSEWIDGINLTDCSQERIRELIPLGVELFLTQLLDIGKFHSDPHGANLLVTKEGKLCLLDFGLCATVTVEERRAMTTAIVHLLTRDFDTLVSKDAKALGFLPEDFDTTQVKPLLTKILTVGLLDSPSSNLRHRKRKLFEISNELNQVFFQYPFSVPPFFALVTRGLGLLEGIALSGDPDFDIFRASAPYAHRRAIALLGRHSFATRLTAARRSSKGASS